MIAALVRLQRIAACEAAGANGQPRPMYLRDSRVATLALFHQLETWHFVRSIQQSLPGTIGPQAHDNISPRDGFNPVRFQTLGRGRTDIDVYGPIGVLPQLVEG